MTRTAFPTTYRGRVMPKLICIVVIGLFVVLAIRNPSAAAQLLRGVGHVVLSATDAISALVQQPVH
jgi:hypothetical protein